MKLFFQVFIWFFLIFLHGACHGPIHVETPPTQYFGGKWREVFEGYAKICTKSYINFNTLLLASFILISYLCARVMCIGTY